jgi:phosphatidylcholine synthase
MTQDSKGPPSRQGMRGRQFLAWCVHFYTALGLVCAAGIAIAIVMGPGWFRLAFALMLVATAIDATDGTFARLVQVRKVLPGFDGRRLDDLIDFQTYTSLPLLLLWRAGLLSPELSWCLLLPLLASAYGFCQTAAKTDDGFFLGFPSYWNLVAFYLYVLRPPQWVSLTVLLGLALLTFVPTRYLYPTQRGRINQLSNLLGFIWAGLLVWILVRLPDGPPVDQITLDLALLSLFYPLFYLTISWTISVKYWLRKRRSASPKTEGTDPETILAS